MAAAPRPQDHGLTEPEISVGVHRVLALHFDENSAARYAEYNVNTQAWSEGVIPAGEASTAVDLSVAYDPQTKGFVGAALTSGPFGIATIRYTYDAQTDTGQFDSAGWRVRASSPLAFKFDKPFLVAGQALTSGQEYIVVQIDNTTLETYDPEHGPFRYSYLRSIDGGDCWSYGQIEFADTRTPVEGVFCAQPAVHEGGPLYIAYAVSSPPAIKFLVGMDVNPPPGEYDCEDPSQVGIHFLPLYAPSSSYPPTEMLTVSLNKSHLLINRSLPGGDNAARGRVPQLLADPTNANRLFLVYHDSKTDSPTDQDIDVFIRVIERERNGWVAGPRLPVSRTVTFNESDQFLPAPTVDASGRLHVLYYDDRNYTDDPNDPTHDQQPDTASIARFDAYYAWSVDQGITWDIQQITYSVPDEPAVDFGKAAFPLREYIGIASRGNFVWTAFSGTCSQDTTGNKSVIWSNLIDWNP